MLNLTGLLKNHQPLRNLRHFGSPEWPGNRNPIEKRPTASLGSPGGRLPESCARECGGATCSNNAGTVGRKRPKLGIGILWLMKQKFTSYFWQTQIDVKKATSKDGDGNSDAGCRQQNSGESSNLLVLVQFPCPSGIRGIGIATDSKSWASSTSFFDCQPTGVYPCLQWLDNQLSKHGHLYGFHSRFPGSTLW